jgi:hypothetical protein
MRVQVAVLLCLLAPSFASDHATMPLGKVAEHAVEESKLTLPGSAPFHLKAEITETTNPASDYRAKIEEYWISPTRWRRTIESPGFSQTLIVNGDQVSEINRGDYFPWWLNDLVTAIFDPLPLLEQLKASRVEMAKPSGSEHSQSCSDLKSETGRAVFCFEGSHGLLSSVFTQIGYAAEFKDFKKFKDKYVARRIVIDPEPGTTIEASVKELTDYAEAEGSLFEVREATPVRDRIKSVKVDEDTARKLLITRPEIEWPPVGNGLTTGRCAVYISVDRKGTTREVWPEGCDNPGLQDPLRDQVGKWTFRKAENSGVPVQVEGLITFRFETKIAAALTKPVLLDADARKLATYTVDPSFPAGGSLSGKTVRIRISVNEEGKVIGYGNPDGLPDNYFLSAGSAARQWKFQPYLKDGKPVVFDADIVFQVSR